MPVRLYGLYLARFQFIESGAYKARPVIIVSKPTGEHKIVLAIPLSANTAKEDVDVPLTNWQSGGLIKPTVARVHRLTALLGSNVLELIGELEEQDANNIRQALQQIFEL